MKIVWFIYLYFYIHTNYLAQIKYHKITDKQTLIYSNFIVKCIKTVKEFENGISFVILQNVTLLSLYDLFIFFFFSS
jgi:hypothetical protein